MTSNQSTRRTIDIAVFSAVGSALEILLGSITGTFRFLPFMGIIPATALIAVLAALYTFNKSVRDVFFCGLVIAVLKLLSPSGILVNAVMCVVIETGLFCAVLALIPRRIPVPVRLVLASIVVSAWPVFFKILNLVIFVGIALPEVIVDLTERLGTFFGLEQAILLPLILIIASIHSCAGTMGALTGWYAGKRLLRFRSLK